MQPKPPEAWVSIPYEEKDSTVSHFRYGYRRKSDGAEVLVWEGVVGHYVETEDGHIIHNPSPKQAGDMEVQLGYMLDHGNVSIDDDNKFAVEYIPGGDPSGVDVVTRLADNEYKVRDIVRVWMDSDPTEQ